MPAGGGGTLGVLVVGIAIVPGQREIEGIERPLLHVFPDVQRGELVGLQIGIRFDAAGPCACADFSSREAIRIVQRNVPRSLAQRAALK